MRLTMIGVLLAPLPALAAGDGLGSLDADARVRVTLVTSGERPLTGSLEALRDDRLVLRIDGRPRGIPWSEVGRVELSQGRRVSARWTALGGVVGGAAGAFVGGCLANKDDYGVLCGGQDDTKYLVGGIVGGLAGGALGAWLGKSERWTETDLARLSAASAIRDGGAGGDRRGPPAPRQ